MQQLNRYWPAISVAILTKAASLSEKKVYLYSLCLVGYPWTIHLVTDEIQRALANYINHHRNYLAISAALPVDIWDLIAGLQQLKIEFDSLNDDHSNQTLVAAVYPHNLYALNEANLRLMLEQM